jgi:prolyl-tRNA synthetase
MPLGQRVLDRLRGLVDEELSRAGTQLLGLAGGRLAATSEMSRNLRFRRRDETEDYPFAEQHEAALAMLAGGLSMSYRELPLLLAAARWGNREQSRAQWGLLSAPEFLLHSSYVFAAREEVAGQVDRIVTAYGRALHKAGVETFPLASAPGSGTMEFASSTDLPARELLVCARCGYRAHTELAESAPPEWPRQAEPGVPEAVYGPGLIQVEPLAQFLGIPVHQTTKTMLFLAGGRVIAACVPGVYDVSEVKLARILGCRALELAPVEMVRELTRSEVGYAGPVGLPPEVEVVWDASAAPRTNFEAGANRTDHHWINLNFDRDVPRPERFFDFRVAHPDEQCARCREGTLQAARALPLGHATQLGDLYAELLGARFLDREKATQPLASAAIGFDLTAAMAAIVEANSDSNGIVWPRAVAPFDAHLVSLPPAEEAAAALYRRLTDRGISVLWDDRAESAGVKFSDADLIGNPVRLVLSKRTAGQVEFKPRQADTGELARMDEAIERLATPAGD